jgi:hypothetical protein
MQFDIPYLITQKIGTFHFSFPRIMISSFFPLSKSLQFKLVWLGYFIFEINFNFGILKIKIKKKCWGFKLLNNHPISSF